MNQSILDKIHHSSLKDTVKALLDSIAMEETALSSILGAEADKIKAFVGKDLEFPSNPSTKEIILFNETTNKMMDSLLMTEWLLLRKLDAVLQIDIHQMEDENPSLVDDKESLWEDSQIGVENPFSDYREAENIQFNEQGISKSNDDDEDDFYW